MRGLCGGGKVIAAAFTCVLSAACTGCDPYPDLPSDCATIRAQIEANNEQAEKLAEGNHAVTVRNIAVVVWPVSLAMDTRNAAGAEMDALKARQQYLASLAEQQCEQPAAPSAAASSTAASSTAAAPLRER